MGLDMYAYTMNKELLDEQPDVGFSVTDLVLKAMGFEEKTYEEVTQLTEEDRISYWEQKQKAIDYGKAKFDVDTDFAYWRKFNALHGWMEKLYEAKGGTDTFNCECVRLYPEDLQKLEEDVNNNALVPCAGFFWGAQTIYPEDIEDVKRFINRANTAITEGKAVVYSSWW